MKYLNTASLSIAAFLVSLAAPLGLHHLPNDGISLGSLKAVAAAPLLSVRERLSADDTVIELRGNNHLMDVHGFNGTAGQTVSISLESNEFDTFLLLLDPDNEIVDSNDDISRNNLNSRLELTLTQNGTYKVLVTSVEVEKQGSYQLVVMPQS